jgi:hypothetical protein
MKPAVARVFATYPPKLRRRLLAVRRMIFEVARKTEGVGKLRARMRAGVMIALAALALTASAAELNYDEWIPLDAEALAEAGVKAAYEELLPRLQQYVPAPAAVTERIDNDAPSYAVSCLGTEYPIYAVGDQDESWGRATFAFFDIVNRQLAKTPYRFFAINGGNDLGGMFLTHAQAEAAKKSLPRKQDWPYLPNASKPWYGQYH